MFYHKRLALSAYLVDGSAIFRFHTETSLSRYNATNMCFITTIPFRLPARVE